MSAPKPVVVGIDGSAGSDDAVRWAFDHARRHDRDLRIVTAAHVPGTAGPIAESISRHLPEGIGGAIREEGWRLVDKAAALVAGPESRGRISTEVFTGSAGSVLVGLSAQSDTIVVGARGRGAIASAVLGSVSAQLTQHASCSVAVIRGNGSQGQGLRLRDGQGHDRDRDRPQVPTGPGGIIVGVDGTPSSDPAVAAAFREASLLGAPLTAVHAWSDTPVADHPHSGLHEHFDEDAVGEALVSQQLARYAERYPDVEVSRTVVMDRPAEAIVHAASSARLIVVGTRGRGGVADLMLGSTALKVLRAAHLPVLVAR